MRRGKPAVSSDGVMRRWCCIKCDVLWLSKTRDACWVPSHGTKEYVMTVEQKAEAETKHDWDDYLVVARRESNV